MGHGARRLQSRRHGLGVLAPRPCTQPRLSMGEDGIAEFPTPINWCACPGALERAGLDLEGALFGVSNAEGNHGEDVKEHYFYLDATPTHSYLKMLYKYPQHAFPMKTWSPKTPGAARISGVRTAGHRNFRRGSILRCLRRVRTVRAGDILMKITA